MGKDILLNFECITGHDVEQNKDLMRIGITIGEQPWQSLKTKKETIYNIDTKNIKTFYLSFPCPKKHLVFADVLLEGLKNLIVECEKNNEPKTK